MAASISSALLWPSAGSFQPCSRGTEGKAPLSPAECHLWAAPAGWSHSQGTPAAAAPGTPRGRWQRGHCRQQLPAMKPHHDTSVLRTGLPNTETLQKCVMNSVETNKLAGSQLEIIIFKHLTIPGKRHREMFKVA